MSLSLNDDSCASTSPGSATCLAKSCEQLSLAESDNSSCTSHGASCYIDALYVSHFCRHRRPNEGQLKWAGL